MSSQEENEELELMFSSKYLLAKPERFAILFGRCGLKRGEERRKDLLECLAEFKAEDERVNRVGKKKRKEKLNLRSSQKNLHNVLNSTKYIARAAMSQKVKIAINQQDKIIAKVRTIP